MATMTVQVVGGLCSRFRAVYGAAAYCEATGRELRVSWPLEERSEDLGTFPARCSDIWSPTDSLMPFHEVERIGRVSKDEKVLRGRGDVAFRTCHIEPFLPWVTKPWSHYIGLFKPTKVIDALAAEPLNLYDFPVIGVNVRWALRDPRIATPEWFLSRLGELVRRFPEAKIFLSADAKSTSTLFRQTFPGRIIEQNKGEYPYDRTGILRSAADLYLLAACDWVIGSNHSSYSQTVAFMRGAKYLGWHGQPGGLKGGRYEDMWNLPDEYELQEALS